MIKQKVFASLVKRRAPNFAVIFCSSMNAQFLCANFHFN